MTGMSDERKISLFHPFANWVLRQWYRIVLDLDMQGMEKVPRTGPLLIVINHTHFLDPLIPTAYLRPDIYPMAKAEVFEGKWKWMFEAYGSFPVRRGEADMQAIKRAFRLLRAGHAILMAPEGTRAKVGGLQRAHEGAGLIASRSGVPILPIALWGGRALVPNVKKLRQTPVHVRIHEPIVVRAQDEKFTRHEITAITDEIMYTLASMLPPEYQGVYAGGEGFAPSYLLPYHGQETEESRVRKEVMPLAN
jgi:1-acyl-sn-glycerol-3-phosphate acyltransferase